MSHKVNASREPLNVVGCQWPGVDVPVFPKSASAYFAGAKPAHESSAASSSLQEAMDLKLDNERRLYELREQGKQCLLNRNEQNSKDEGAANVVVRFHTMPWINNPLNPLSEFAAGSSQPNRRTVDNSQVNLVPVKHGEEEYFPGTRQQKKTRRPKNVRTKCETIKLEEVPPGPMDKILPAGYIPSVNAWSVRKGSELFDSRKLSLTLYGPEDEEALYQRALQESMVTLYEEQDRIVSMFSPYHGDSSEQTCDGSNGPKEEAKACDGLAPDTGGSGDGRWVKNESSSIRPRNETKTVTASKSQDLGKRRLSEAGDTGYGRNCSRENFGNGIEKPGNWTKYTYNRPQSDKNIIETNFRKSVKEDNKEAKLESLGFNKSRAAQYAQRETSRKREDKKTGSNSERFEKQQPQDAFAPSGGGSTQRNSARDRHIKFSDPIVQNPKNGRTGTKELNQNDEDPWLETEEQTEVPSETAVCLIAHIQPYDIEREKLYSPKKCDRSEVESKVTQGGTKREVAMKPLNVKEADHKETPLELTKEIAKVEPVQNGSSPRRGSISPGTASSSGHLEVSSTVEVSIPGDSQDKEEKMKKMREELEFLDNRLKQLSSALEQTNLEGSVPQECPNTKTESLDSSEKQEVSTAQIPPMSTVQIPPVSTAQVPPVSTAQIPPVPTTQVPHVSTSQVPPEVTSQVPPEVTSQVPSIPTSHDPPMSSVPISQKTMSKDETSSTDGLPFNAWFSSVPNSLSHVMCPQQIPQPSLVHTLRHPFAHPMDQTVAFRADCPLTPGQAQMIGAEAPPPGAQVKPEDGGQTQTQEHCLAQGQGIAQSYGFPGALQIPLQHYSQGPQSRSPTQLQLRAPADPQLHLQAQPQTPLLQAQGMTAHQLGEHASRPAVHPESLLAHLQQRQQAPVPNAKPEQIAQAVAEQQYMAMQGAAAAAAAAAAASASFPPACAPNGVPLVWLGLGPQLPPSSSSWFPQMNLPPGPATGTAQATSGEDLNSINVTPHPAVTASDARVSREQKNADEGKPVEGIEIAATLNGPVNAHLLSAEANSVPASRIPVVPNSTSQKCPSATTANSAPATDAEVPAHFQWFTQMKALQQQQQHQYQQQQQHQLQQQQLQTSGAGVQNPACAPASAIHAAAGGPVPMEWFSHMKVLQQQQQQQQMIHLASMVPGMHPSFPIQQLPSPFMAAGVPGLGWPVCAPSGKIPPQYEGDWIISPADESRLAQGLPLVPNENHKNLSPGRTNIPGPAQFSDAAESSTGSGHALGLAEAGPVKMVHPPLTLKDLKRPTIVNAQTPMQLVEPRGLLRRGKAQSEEPRGRGRLR